MERSLSSSHPPPATGIEIPPLRAPRSGRNDMRHCSIEAEKSILTRCPRSGDSSTTLGMTHPIVISTGGSLRPEWRDLSPAAISHPPLAPKFLHYALRSE